VKVCFNNEIGISYVLVGRQIAMAAPECGSLDIVTEIYCHILITYTYCILSPSYFFFQDFVSHPPIQSIHPSVHIYSDINIEAVTIR
jgi:hypothetical protein